MYEKMELISQLLNDLTTTTMKRIVHPPLSYSTIIIKHTEDELNINYVDARLLVYFLIINFRLQK